MSAKQLAYGLQPIRFNVWTHVQDPALAPFLERCQCVGCIQHPVVVSCLVILLFIWNAIDELKLYRTCSFRYPTRNSYILSQSESFYFCNPLLTLHPVNGGKVNESPSLELIAVSNWDLFDDSTSFRWGKFMGSHFLDTIVFLDTLGHLVSFITGWAKILSLHGLWVGVHLGVIIEIDPVISTKLV